MQTSHKLTRIFVALFALVMMAAAALAGDPAQNIGVSDQKAGSLLVFPYYTSSSGQTKADTRISISNTGNQFAIVHVFYLQGRDCTQADQFVCLTPNASIVMRASDFDPENTGYILAVAVDGNGIPTQNNGLIGNAFVNDGDYVGNYGAEAFWRHNNARTPLVDTNKDDVAVLDFGGRYDYVPCTLTTEIQSPKDAPGQRVVTAGLFGDISGLDPLRIGSIRGAGQVGIGQAYNAQEKFASFSRWLNGACQADARITETSPRVPSGLGSLIGAGNAGTIKFNVGVVVGSPIFGVPSGDVIGGAVGLLMTPKTNAWKGIRTLHKTKQTISFVTIPVFMPYC
ncbi:MAG TPA: hypothetical protein VFZ34_26960 [Blastocatellia bacterium]|nr:hypothetical protein [Blastocatellia bacterium]